VEFVLRFSILELTVKGLFKQALVWL